MFKNLKLATKMFLSFGVVALIALSLGLFGYYGAVRSERAIEEVGAVRLPSVESLLVIKENANAIKVVQRTLLDLGLERAERQRQYDDFTAIRQEYQAAWQAYEPLPQTPEEAELWNQFVPAWQQWRTANDTFFDMSRRIDTLDLGDPLELTKQIRTFIGDHYRLEASVLKLLAGGETFAGGDNHETCNYGSWVGTFSTSNAQMNKIIEETFAPHNKTHESVKQIKELVAAGQSDQADYLYRTVFIPSIAETFGKFDQILHQAEEALGLAHQLEQLALNDLRAAEKKAIDLLDRIIDINTAIAGREVVASQSFASRLEVFMLSAAGLGTGLAILIAFLITRAITRPLTNAVSICEELSRGNLTMDITVDGRDETSQLLAAMKAMVESLRSMFTDITSGVTTLASSSTELSAVSAQLSANAENAASRSTGVASAAEEMTTNMNSVSAAMEQSASNVGMVATATEEMSSTVSEIAQNAAKAKDISEQAVSQSQQTSAKMNELGRAADKIGKVTEAITEISEQTNLLALNATIEAARAGEAGKGFAVVANEIKELAKQTAAATVDIKNQIEEMQDTTGGTITDIEQIGQVITEINEIITSIATAVEQQSAATSEISENIAQASAGISEVNENVAQSSLAIADITQDIGQISTSSTDVNQGSNNVKESATELSRLAEQLDGLMRRFQLA